jgi:hypothetical protein
LREEFRKDISKPKFILITSDSPGGCAFCELAFCFRELAFCSCLPRVVDGRRGNDQLADRGAASFTA